MTNAEKILKRIEDNRPKVLNEKARAYAISLTKDKAKARAFLTNAGFIDKNGNLTPEYQNLPEDIA